MHQSPYESSQLSFLEPGDDVREVHNYVITLDYGLERLKILPISLRLIREIHEKLMHHGGNLTPGEFRRTQNWIGPAGSTIMTAIYMPHRLMKCTRLWAIWSTSFMQVLTMPALVRAAMIHYRFEALQPFLDGNGRVGRLRDIVNFSQLHGRLLDEAILYLLRASVYRIVDSADAGCFIFHGLAYRFKNARAEFGKLIEE